MENWSRLDCDELQNDMDLRDFCSKYRIKISNDFVQVNSNEVMGKLMNDFTEDFTSLFILKCLLFMTLIAGIIAVFASILSVNKASSHRHDTDNVPLTKNNSDPFVDEYQ